MANDTVGTLDLGSNIRLACIGRTAYELLDFVFQAIWNSLIELNLT